MTDEPSTLIDMLRAAASRVGDTRGIRFYESPKTSEFVGYDELDGRSRRIATALAQRGLAPGDSVVLALHPGLEFIEAVYGALYAGLSVVPAPVGGIAVSDVATEQVTNIVRASGSRAVLTHEAVTDLLSAEAGSTALADAAGVPVATISDLFAQGDADSWKAPVLNADSMAGMLFTSGSTGNPKGVIMTHGSLLACASLCQGLLDMTTDSVFVGWAPLHHAMGLIVQAFLPVYAAADAVLTSTAQFQRRPVFWLQLMSRHHATISVAGNFAFDLCTQFATDEQISELDLSSLTALMTGSEPVRTDTVRRFVERFAPSGVRESMIMPAMGMTEAMLISAKSLGTDLVIVNADSSLLEGGTLREGSGAQTTEMVSCGPAAPLCNIVIIDPEQDTPVALAENQVGEIWITSPGASPGYWQNPEATAEVFGWKVPGDDRDYVRTGDLGALVDGELFVTGRLKDLIIIRGRNLYPQDLEASARLAHAAVGIGAAFELTGHPSDVGIVLEIDDAQLTEAGIDLVSLTTEVRAALISRYSLPSLAVAFIGEGTLPRTPSGKVKRSLTRSKLDNGELSIVHADGFAPLLQATDGAG